MDPQSSSQDVRVRNVSLHRRGKPETGTLYLTRHHLIFSYHPAASTSESRTHSRQPAAPISTSSNLLNGSAEAAGSQPSSESTDSSSAGASAQPISSKLKSKPKEIYVPYPLVHHCILRPSYAQGGYRPSAPDTQSQRQDEDEDLFPPTYGTSTYGRPSGESANLTPFSSPRRPVSPMASEAGYSPASSARPPAIRIKCKDFAIFALHFHASVGDKTPDDAARQVFYALRAKCCVSSIEEMYAFHFKPPAEETSTGGQLYDVSKEFARMGISSKAADGPGTAWRITDINHDYAYSVTYPNILCVPRAVSDNILKYCGTFRSKSRIPALAYLHPNGGSITRSSQPMVGVQGKRNPQDEKLVSAIFSSHTPPLQSPEGSPPQLPSLTSPSTTTLDSISDPEVLDADVPDNQLATEDEGIDRVSPGRRRVYGSTRRNLIVDARPRINMIANKAAGGGIEDVANYMGGSETPVEKVFLNIANIHAMRSSLEKVVESMGSSDYIDLPPNQELLRKSGWLGHIAAILDGAEMVARVVGLGGSHALIHCSDGWDRTSQISALAQVMLDPHYRTLKGFITLVQKDFLSFGHKFRHRQGVEGSEKWFEIENERVQPTRSRENADIQAFGSKALLGARSWFEKNRSNLFRQQPGGSQDALDGTSRPTTPPPNPILHSTPSPKVKEEKHKMDDKEVAPIFHQFLDSVYQLLSQLPGAFEFNERFLRRLLYQTYSGQYGEFLFVSEKERSECPEKTASVWGYFHARVPEFTNPEYVSKTDDPLLFPRRKGYDREIEVRWWSSLFGRKDEEMNVPRALATVETPSMASHFSSLSLDERGASLGLEEPSSRGEETMGVKAARSTPALKSLLDGERLDGSQDNGIGLTSTKPVQLEQATSKAAPPHRANIELPTPIATQEQRHGSEPSTVAAAEQTGWEIDGGGDPLGVNSAQKPSAGRLDFAAFAQQNAFSER